MTDAHSAGPMPSWAERALGALVALAVFAMMALIFIDVFLRYFFNAPLVGAFEAVQFLLAIVIFGALPMVSASEGHIVIGLMEGYFRGSVLRIQRVVVSLISTGASGLIAWLMVLQGRSAAQYQKVTGYLELPLSWLAYSMAGFAALTMLVQVALLWSRLRPVEAQR